uniref:Cyclic nucleotide-binding domain-containing protein n=1 Tax=Poecilia reticulata TaxID=8081 RepID=A0A3P9Q856_POERE
MVKKTARSGITLLTTNLIVKAIQKNDFLSRLDDEQIAMMVDLLMSSNYKPSEEVIKEGSEGDSMYIVAAGELIVTQSGRDLRTLTKGDVFGELAILYNCKRTATVKAKTHVHLWRMERQTYRTIITNKSKKKREQLMGEVISFIRRMGKGEHFGDNQILRTATCTADGPVTCFSIDKE